MADIAPLGTISSEGNVTVGNSSAPTGTTIFSGDRVASSQPALIDFSNGSRIEMAKASATFSRDGKTLVIKADQGLLRFNFAKGEDVSIDTGKYRITSEGSSGNMGELGLNSKGQMIVEMLEGSVSVLNKSTGQINKATLGRPLVLFTSSGNGNITNNGSSLTDASKIFNIDEFRGMCIVGGDEAYPISGNSSSQIAIKGNWQKDTGTIDYQVVECTEQAMTDAGASSEAASAAADAATGIAGASGFPTAAAVAGVAAGAGVGIGVWQSTKSPSSR